MQELSLLADEACFGRDGPGVWFAVSVIDVGLDDTVSLIAFSSSWCFVCVFLALPASEISENGESRTRVRQ